MTIKRKLLIMSLVVAFVGMILLIMQGVTQNNLSRYISGVSAISDAESDLLEMRQIEKDFLLSYDLKYLVDFRYQFIHLLGDLEQIERFLRSVGYSNQHVVDARSLLKQYRRLFNEVAAVSERIGTDEISGLRGELRVVAHQLEDYFRANSNYELLEDLLMLRRHEKDFLLRTELKYRDRLIADVDVFRKRLEFMVNSAERSKVLQHLDDYRQIFEQLVVDRQQLGLTPTEGLYARLNHAAIETEHYLSLMVAELSQYTHNRLRQIQQWSLWGLAALVLFVMFWVWRVSRGISRATARLAGEVHAIGELDDHSVRLEISSEDEIGQLSESINQMLERIEQGNSELMKAMEATLIAEKVARTKDEFLASMSHELRTPLTTIIGNSELLSEQDLNRDQHELLYPVAIAGRNLLALVNDILDVSKIESGKFEIDIAPFCLDSLMRETQLLFSTSMEGTAVQFTVEQKIHPVVQIWGDQKRVGQILLNLLSNARKFTDQGRVTMSCWLEGETLCFSVEDTGIGMSADVLSRLFKPFEQADSSISRRFGGSGLGLHISWNLAQLMGGTIEVSSEEGRGSRFVLKLPYEESDLPVRDEQSGQSDKGIETVAFTGEVLVVEDTPELRLLESRILESMGLRVVLADNGREAVELALEQQFDLILMDMQMPVMDGLEATRLLRQQGNRTPIIALTANVMQQHRDAFFAAGCDGFLGKPMNRGEVVRALKVYLQEEAQVDKAPDEPATEVQVAAATNKEERAVGSNVILGRVLVIDDEQQIFDLYRIALEKSEIESEFEGILGDFSISEQSEVAGSNLFEVTYARQGSDGVELARIALEQGHPYPVAFIDMRMPPGMNGLETAKALRSIDERIFIVIVSAYSDVPLNQINRELGHDVLYLNKPFESREVNQLARMLIQGWEKYKHKKQGVQEAQPSVSETIARQRVDPVIDDDLMQMFMERMGELKVDLVAVLEGENWNRLSDIAYTIKGSARTFGFLKMGDLAAEMQSFIRLGEMDQVRLLANDLMAEIDRVLTT